jgi:hypothetical protein
LDDISVETVLFVFGIAVESVPDADAVRITHTGNKE